MTTYVHLLLESAILVTHISLLRPTHQVPFSPASLVLTIPPLHHSSVQPFLPLFCLFSHLPASLHVTLSSLSLPSTSSTSPLPSLSLLPTLLPPPLTSTGVVRSTESCGCCAHSRRSLQQWRETLGQPANGTTSGTKALNWCEMQTIWNWTHVATCTRVIVCMLSVHLPLNEKPATSGALRSNVVSMWCSCMPDEACTMQSHAVKCWRRSDSVLVLHRKYQSMCYQSYLTGCTISIGDTPHCLRLGLHSICLTCMSYTHLPCSESLSHEQFGLGDHFRRGSKYNITSPCSTVY